MPKELTKDELKKSEAHTLEVIREFCDKHNLKYYIAFGTLLGSVRHKGFIPWDDDIDILMPRKDYMYLINNFNNENICENNRKVISGDLDLDAYFGYAKVIDTNTYLIEKGRKYVIGAFVDIFPLDNMPRSNTNISKIKNMFFYTKIRSNQRIIRYWQYDIKNMKKWYKKLCIIAIRICHPFLKKRKDFIHKFIQKYSENEALDKYGLLYKDYGKYGIPMFSKAMFEPSVKLEFEGGMYNAPRLYDELLTLCYGNYKKLPPKSKRKSHHSFKCYWKD